MSYFLTPQVKQHWHPDPQNKSQDTGLRFFFVEELSLSQVFFDEAASSSEESLSDAIAKEELQREVTMMMMVKKKLVVTKG